MKELVREYHSLYQIHMDNHPYIMYKGLFAANYRILSRDHESSLLRCIWSIDSNKLVIELPKKYFFSSGLNSPKGYKNK